MAARRLTRRQALVAATAAGLAAGPGTSAGRRGRRRRVVIVGAGIAGLAAATAAQTAGWEVVVLEAADRVGGRILTLRGFAGGQVAEAGGEYLDGGHHVMRGYAQRLGLRLDDLYAAGSDHPGCLYLDGRRRADPEPYDRAERRLAAALAAATAGPDRPVSDVLDALAPGRAARRYLEHAVIRDDYTVEAGELSARFAARSADASGGSPERYRVRGGNDQVPRGLAEALGGRVALSSPVTAVARDAGGVTVTVGDEAIRAEACILAAPLPALRAIAFTPDLPDPLRRAVAELRYGVGAKVALQYADRPWRHQGFNGDTRTDLPISTAWEATDAQAGPHGILLVYTVGAPGRASVALPADDRIAAAAADVARIYPGAAPVAGATMAWPHTYAAYAPGQYGAFRAALRRPAGRIVLAGEHVSDVTGYMEGAALSGLRAARLVAAIAR